MMNHPKLYTKERNDYQPPKPKVKKLIVPENFHLLQHTDTVLGFINDFKAVKNRYKFIDHISLDLSAVSKIDAGALSLLLSAVYDVSKYIPSIGGNSPRDKYTSKVFRESGFLTHMKKISGDIQAHPNNNNLIIRKGKDRTKTQAFGSAIKNAVETLTGEKNHYPPVYTMVLEMSGNSVEHAYEDNKHWLLGVHSINDEDKVLFTFSDNGFGIFKTLNRKYSHEIKDRFFDLSNRADIVFGAFERKYGSRTKEINRNRGLPSILKILQDQKVDNLILITNNVFIDFSNNNRILLKNKFGGTFYYWELNKRHLRHE